MAASTAPVIELWNDIVNNRLIAGRVGTNGWDGSPFTFANTRIWQAAQLRIRWYPIKPDGQFAYVLVPVAGLVLDIAVGPRAGAENILARQNAWTATGDYLEAVLNLNTTNLNTAIGTSDSYSTYIEISLTENGNERPAYQEAITILSRVIGPAGDAALPAAASQFLTREQSMAMFVRFVENIAGATIELTSLDGTHIRLIGCNNDGSAQDEVS